MFKILCLKALRLIAVVVLLVNVTLTFPAFAQTESSTNSETSLSTETLDIQTDRSIDQTDQTDDQLTERTSDVERSDKTQSSTRTYAKPPHPYDMEAIEKFDEELYGPEY